MWTQFWLNQYSSNFHSILVEAEPNEAVMFLREKGYTIEIWPGKQININDKCYQQYNNYDLMRLTCQERNANLNGMDYIDGIMIHYKKLQEKMPKHQRFVSLKDYLNSPNVKIYYKKDVDTIMEQRV